MFVLGSAPCWLYIATMMLWLPVGAWGTSETVNCYRLGLYRR